jgi:hypothetical protein
VITVLTWLWAQPGGRTKFTAEHVNIWADMVRRNLAMPHRIACVTATPEGIDPGVRIIAPPGDFEDVLSKHWGGSRPNCYRRLSMFRRDAGKLFGQRFVCMDLDCVIGGALDPLFDRPDEFVIFKGTAPERPYNGSMMLIRAGCRPQVFENFDQRGADKSGAKFVGSDQAWLAHCLGWGEATWDESDGVWFFGKRYLAEVKKAQPRVLFFPGKRKPWELAPVFPFMKRNYRIEAKEAA